MLKSFSIPSSDGKNTLACYQTDPAHPRAMVQISHGMCEYFERYTDFAGYLTERGYLVFGHDHLGHGHTAPDRESLGFTASGGGAGFLVEDLHALSLCMKERYPGLPIILLGHSMGSFIARETVARYGNDYRAAIFCGTGGPDMPTTAGKLFSQTLMLFRGEHYRSALLKKLAFLGYNSRYEHPETTVDWLTHDREVIERYLNDPLCNFTFTLRAYHDLFTLVAWVSHKEWASRLPGDLPILVTSGAEDPVGGWGKGVEKVAARLKEVGMNVTLRLYPGMRHEILNEIGREDVRKEIEQWMSILLQ